MTALMLLAGLAQAADPTFEGTKKEAEVVEKAEYHLAAEFGGALTTGNSEFYTLSAGLNGAYKRGRHQIKLVGGAVAGSSRVDGDGDGTLSDAEKSVPMSPNAGRVYGDLRYDLFLSDKDSLYVLFGAFHDKFAGFDYRLHEQLGYSRHLVKTDKTSLIAELGVDFAQENYVAGVDPNSQLILAARGMVGFSYKFNDSVGLSNTLEAYENVLTPADLRVLNTASLVAALGSKFSIKLSHGLIFDNVPVEGYRKLDQTMMVTLVASVL